MHRYLMETVSHIQSRKIICITQIIQTILYYGNCPSMSPYLLTDSRHTSSTPHFSSLAIQQEKHTVNRNSSSNFSLTSHRSLYVRRLVPQNNGSSLDPLGNIGPQQVISNELNISAMFNFVPLQM